MPYDKQLCDLYLMHNMFSAVDAAFGIIVQNVGADLEMCVSRAISRSLFEVYRSLMMNTEPGEAVS